MKPITKLKLSLTALTLAGMLAPSAFAATAPSAPANTANADASAIAALAASIQANGAKKAKTPQELKDLLKDLKKDAYQLKKLVNKSFKDILKGKIAVGDSVYLARCQVYIDSVNEINSEIDQINVLLASGDYAGAQKKYDKIHGKLEGIVAAGNLIWPPGVSLHG